MEHFFEMVFYQIPTYLLELKDLFRIIGRVILYMRIQILFPFHGIELKSISLDSTRKKTHPLSIAAQASNQKNYLFCRLFNKKECNCTLSHSWLAVKVTMLHILSVTRYPHSVLRPANKLFYWSFCQTFSDAAISRESYCQITTRNWSCTSGRPWAFYRLLLLVPSPTGCSCPTVCQIVKIILCEHLPAVHFLQHS